MPKYIGATIGPIVGTLMSAKSTKEIWGASYLFSYIMKKIINEIKNKEFIIPYTGDNKYFNEPNKAGLFHDRFIIKTQSEKDFSDVIDAKEKVFKDLTSIINENLEKKMPIGYLNDYIKFNLVEIEVEEKDNIIFKVSKYLDILELQPQMCQARLKYNYLIKYFRNSELFYKDAFGEDENEFRIKSLPEIAMTDIMNNLKDCSIDKRRIKYNFKEQVEQDDEKSYKILSSYGKEFKKHHKYYAIVRADGDNIGEVIKGLKKSEEYQDFSKQLFEFSKESVEIIKDYEGLTIYAGGDDLLFFAPIINKKENIFTLIEKISKNFKKKIEDRYNEKLNGVEKRPTLSFGIDIRYYKDPMSTSLEESATMLFGKAKNYKDKNAVGLKLNKHSGTEVEFTLEKESGLYKKLEEMIKENYEMKLLKGVMYKLEGQRSILNEILGDEDKIENFFNNNFKKDMHNDLSKIISLINMCKTEDELNDGLNILRFIAFLSEKGGK